MAIPKAIVKIRLDALHSIPAAFTNGRQIVYATTKIGNRQLGRTAQIPAGSTDFAINREMELALGEKDSLNVLIDIWEDRGDEAPVPLGQLVVPPIGAPWAPRTLAAGAGPIIECTITEVREVPKDTRPPVAGLRNSTGAPKSPASIKPVRAFCVEITEVLGLYDPGQTTPLRRANYRAGYLSEDHLGRVYLNCDLNGNWTKDTQLIQLTAQVTVRGGKLPAGAKIRWSVIDPDDPFDDQPEVHRQWAPYLDKNDYTGSPPTLLGATANDNEGKPDRSPAWEEVPGFALDAAQGTTVIAGPISKVKLHCPNVAGDNLIVRAEFEPAKREEVFAAETGVMTMWNRVDVEYNRMEKAFDLEPAFPAVVKSLEHACIQLDFVPEPAANRLPEQAQMGRNSDTLETDAAAYINTNFKHRGQKGWFCLFSAMEPHSLPSPRGELYFDDELTLQMDAGNEDSIVFSGSHPEVSHVELTWGTETVGFDVDKINRTTVVTGRILHDTQCWLAEHDTCSDFVASDGAHDAFKSKIVLWGPRGKFVQSGPGWAWSAGGYGIPAKVRAKVYGPGKFYNNGISPSVAKGGKDYFAGRTVIFTHHIKFREDTGAQRPDFYDNVAQVITHELTHAFGLPHKCGYWDYRTPRRPNGHTCCMNYSPNWMLDAAGNLEAGTSKKVGPDLCGRHIKELRRTHLEDNLGLGW